jgi:hypothetical protein
LKKLRIADKKKEEIGKKEGIKCKQKRKLAKNLAKKSAYVRQTNDPSTTT